MEDVLRPQRAEWFESSAVRWQKLAFGPNFGAALDEKGTLFVWGEGAAGSAPVGPLQVDAQGEGRGRSFVDAQCATDKIVALTTGGQVVVFDNISGVLTECAASGANPQPPLRLRGGLVPGMPQPGWLSGSSKVAQMSIGPSHAAFVTQGGEVFCVGDNQWGQCGAVPPKQKIVRGAYEDRSGFQLTSANKVTFPPEAGRITQVSVGGRHTICRNAAGGTYAFGDDRRIQLGLGDTRSGGTTDERHSYGVIRQDQLGGKVNKTELKRAARYKYYDPHMKTAPVETVAPVVYNRPPYPRPSFVTCGEDFTIAMHIDSPDWVKEEEVTNVLVCCGENGYGQCGRGSQAQQQAWAAVRLPKRSRTASLTCGEAHCLALQTTGDLYAWGYSLSGQIGHGKRSVMSTPVRIGLAPSVREAEPVKNADGTMQWSAGFAPLPGKITHIASGPKSSAVICEVAR